jgi:hypothetical protein
MYLECCFFDISAGHVDLSKRGFTAPGKDLIAQNSKGVAQQNDEIVT